MSQKTRQSSYDPRPPQRAGVSRRIYGGTACPRRSNSRREQYSDIAPDPIESMPRVKFLVALVQVNRSRFGQLRGASQSASASFQINPKTLPPLQPKNRGRKAMKIPRIRISRKVKGPPELRKSTSAQNSPRRAKEPTRLDCLKSGDSSKSRGQRCDGWELHSSSW